MAETHFTGILRASLIGVPPEIRLRIFNYVFDCSKIVITLGPRYNDESVWPVKKDVASYRKSITQVDSLLRQEALAILYHSTTLRIKSITLWNQDELYLNDLLRKLLGHAFLRSVIKVSIDHDQLDSLPVGQLPALQRVALWWKILTDDEKLLEDLDAADPTLHQMILENVTRDVSKGRIGNALDAFRRKLIQQSRRIQCVWAVFFNPSSCCERGRYALVDLDARGILYARTMLDSEWCRRVKGDGELYPDEGSDIENTATRDHSCDWCIANLRRERQSRLNKEMSSAIVGNETVTVICPT